MSFVSSSSFEEIVPDSTLAQVAKDDNKVYEEILKEEHKDENDF